MNSSHTPGPYAILDLPGEFAIVQSGRPGDIATIEYDEDDPEDRAQAEANARMFVAGPEMLDAIWQALDDMADSLCVCEDTKQQLKEAFAKATGSPAQE